MKYEKVEGVRTIVLFKMLKHFLSDYVYVFSFITYFKSKFSFSDYHAFSRFCGLCTLAGRGFSVEGLVKRLFDFQATPSSSSSTRQQ